jgi:hypothetical protein
MKESEKTSQRWGEGGLVTSGKSTRSDIFTLRYFGSTGNTVWFREARVEFF